MDNNIERKTSLGELKAPINRRMERVRESQKSVAVYGTGKSKHMIFGKKYTASVADSKLLVENGIATLTEPKIKPKTEAKEEPKKDK